MSENNVSIEESRKIIQAGKRGLWRVIFSRSMVILLTLLLQLILYFLMMFSFFRYVTVFVGGMTVFAAIMMFVVLNTRTNPSIKLSWCIIIAVMPLFGTVLYFFTKYDLGYRLEQKVLGDCMKESEVYVPEQRELLRKVKTEDKRLYNLTEYLRSKGQHAIYANTDVKYFPSGEHMFVEMLKQIEKAEKFLFLEYFIIGPGYMWNTILDLLIRKARQGVEVRLIYDGSNEVTSLPYGYHKKLQKAGIQCKIFAEFHPFVSTIYNNRDHRKILVADGKVAFTGGVNLQDEYINKKTLHGHWKDTGVMLQGDGAQGFTLLFLQMWNADEKKRNYAPYLRSVSSQIRGEGYVIPYGDTPLDDENVGEMVYLDMINRAKEYVYIMTPYLILDNELLTALCFAAKRGVDIRIILPHIPDKKYAFCLAKSHYRDLVEAGVKVYEYTPGFVHAKVVLCDDKEAVVGSINFDYRSLYLHFECAVYLYKVAALQDIKNDFAKTVEKSEWITMEAVRKQPWYVKIFGKLLKVIAPLM